ncbi:olfactory receptor 56-like [Monodelphis domestica]|nr:olfactory receptor 56-like [Monodelphis domestica]
MNLGNQTSKTDFFLLGLFNTSELHYFLFSLAFISFLLTLLSNGLMVFLIYVEVQLHTPMYFFLGQLSFMDMLLACTTVPKMATNFLSGRKSISFVGCGFQIFFFLTLGGGECFLLAFMAYDRYVAITKPLRYPTIMTNCVCWLMAATSWLLGVLDGLIQGLVTLTFPFCGLRVIDHFFCEVPAVLALACADTTTFETVMYVCCVGMLLIPFLIILASYAQILVAVLQMTSTKGKKKAFSTCSSHLAVVILFYGTVISIYMVPHSHRSPGVDKTVAAFYTFFIPTLNPFIYSLRNKDVMGALGKLLGKIRLCRNETVQVV